MEQALFDAVAARGARGIGAAPGEDRPGGDDLGLRGAQEEAAPRLGALDGHEHHGLLDGAVRFEEAVKVDVHRSKRE